MRKLPHKARKLLHGFGALAMVAIAASMVWLGAGLCLRQLTTGAVSNTALRFPLWIVTISMVIGFGLLMAHGWARVRGREPEPLSRPTESAE